MEIYSEPDYYPSPSSAVILYSDQPVTRARRAVSQADIYALIVYLSSPVDPVSYSIFSDFFLVYREFITPITLYDLLIKRFEWCIAEINQEDIKRSKIGNIALVRTFVFIRHGILNHFIEDFLPDENLRLLFIGFLNREHSDSTKIVKNCIVNLKKIWIHCMKSTWDNVEFDEPINSNNGDINDLWLAIRIKDITQLNNEMKRASRLSASALQGISSPDFRNRSVMSLYKDQENFQLVTPEETEHVKKLSRRTPSMLLNPESNFNYAARIPSSNSLNDKHSDDNNDKIDEIPATVTPNSSNENIISDKPIRRKVSIMSRLPPNMSPTITDLEYPRNSRIDKIIPPTPAKKIEIILNSNYMPEGEPVPKPSNINNNNKAPTRSNSILSRSSTYLGPMGLLNKWKGNHSRNKKHAVNSPYKKTLSPNDTNQVNRIVKPQMDAFVKYVISISSLDNHIQDSNEAINLDSSKFDILSARTIDEVEFLLNLENNLLEKVNNMKEDHVTISTQETEDNTDGNIITKTDVLPKPVNNFSAMDNLDLYQTVSSIAQSVISLSNTLNMTNNNGANDDISAPFSSRRKVKSSTAALFGQPNNSSRFLLENQNFNERNLGSSPKYVDGPQRLVFHATSNESSSRPTSSYSNLSNSTPTKINRSPNRKRSSSPLKKMLDDLQEVDIKEEEDKAKIPSLVGKAQNGIEPEYVSYDSDLSLSNHSIKQTDLHSGVESKDEPNLKKKNSFGNLREFTFEDDAKNMTSTTSIPQLHHPSQQVNDSLDVITGLYGSSDTANGSTANTVSTSLQSEAREDISPLQDINKLTNSPVFDRQSVTVAAIRPASGRISLIKRNTIQSNKHKTVSPLSPGNVNIAHTDFYQKDKLLQESEKKLITLEKNMAQRDSATPSIATTTLFNSRNNSPRKGLQTNVQADDSTNPRIRLSIQPSIQSIISDGTFSSYSTFESKPNKRVSLRSKFQEGIANSSGPQFETASTNKYIFEPDSESIDGTSPAKDMEELKSKFLKKEDTKSPDKVEAEPSIDDTSPHKDISQRLNEEALKNIADMTDDTIQDDPLRVAMMKLEGTYIKTKHILVTESSPDVSKISKEVEMLNISTVLSIPNTPHEKRKSLLIQRRRQTLMNIPYTPPVVDNENDNNHSSQNDIDLIQPGDIQKLLADYEIHDPNLSISNNEHHIPFILTYDSLSIARQMTLIEKELLCEIDWKDLLDLKIHYNGPPVTSWLQLLVQNENLSGVDLAIARFNLTVDWIISEISITKDVKIRRNTIQRFIHVAEHCRKFQNYNTLMQIVLALNSVVVQRFIDAWRLIEPGDLLTWEELKQIPSLDRNYANIRKLLNHIDPLKGCIPFIVVYLSDLSINAEKRTWIEPDKVINYNKFDTNVQIVKHFIQRVQWCKHYDFEVDHELLSKCIYLTALTQDEIHQLSTRSPPPSHN